MGVRGRGTMSRSEVSFTGVRDDRSACKYAAQKLEGVDAPEAFTERVCASRVDRHKQ